MPGFKVCLIKLCDARCADAVVGVHFGQIALFRQFFHEVSDFGVPNWDFVKPDSICRSHILLCALPKSVAVWIQVLYVLFEDRNWIQI